MCFIPYIAERSSPVILSHSLTIQFSATYWSFVHFCRKLWVKRHPKPQLCMILLTNLMWFEVNIYCVRFEVVHLKHIASTQTTLSEIDYFNPLRHFYLCELECGVNKESISPKQKGQIPAASLWTVVWGLDNLTEQCTEPFFPHLHHDELRYGPD